MKKETNIQEFIKNHTSDVGITIMALATLVGLVDLQEHTVRPVVITSQPSKYSNVDQLGDDSNPLRREKEENAKEYISYSEAERTPSRSRKFEAV